MNASDLNHALESVFFWTLQTSLYATVLIGLVFAVQFCFRKVLAPRWRYGLSLLVVLRLALPGVPQSSLSVFNLFQRAPTIESAVVINDLPTAPIELPGPPAAEVAGAPVLPVEPQIEATTLPRFRFGPLLKFIWLAGFVGIMTVVVRQHRRFVLASRRWGAVTDPRVLGLLDECRNVIGVRRTVKLLAATGLNTPALFGFWRPRLLMPAELLSRLTDQELRHVFLHELLHLRRGDVLVNWALIVLRAVHWFNPAVWLAFRQLRANQELACDAAVMARLDIAERKNYGGTLIKLLEDFSAQALCPGVVPFVTNKQVIKRRISMIAQFKPAGRLALFGSMAAVAIVGLIAFTRAAERPRPQGETLAYETFNSAIHGEATPLAVDPASPEIQRLAQQLADLNKQVKRQEEKILDLRSAMQQTDSNIRNPTSANDAIAATILQLNSLKVQLGNEAFKEEVLLKQLGKLDVDRAGTATTRIIPDPILTQLVQEKLATEARLASLQSDKSAEHPEVKQAAEVRKKLQSQIAEQLDAIKAAQLAKIESLHAQLDNTQKQLSQASEYASQAAARNGEIQLTLKKHALENAMLELQDLKQQLQDTQKQTEMRMGTGNKQAFGPEARRKYADARALLSQASADLKQERLKSPENSPLLEPFKRRVDQFEAEVTKLEAQYPGIGATNKLEDDWSSSSTQRLTIEGDGTMKFGSSGETISVDRLKSALMREHEKDPNMGLIIKADSTVAFQRIVEIFDTAKKAGISSISLQTLPNLK